MNSLKGQMKGITQACQIGERTKQQEHLQYQADQADIDADIDEELPYPLETCRRGCVLLILSLGSQI
jgi:hypothetical protein